MLFNTKPWKFVWRENYCFQIRIFLQFPPFSWWSPPYQKPPATAHRVPKIKAEMLCCSSIDAYAKLTTGEEGWPKQQMALSYQHFLPDLGWLKGWKVHQHNLAALGVLQTVTVSLGCRRFTTSLRQSSPLPPTWPFSPGPRRRHRIASTSRVVPPLSHSWQWWKDLFMPF